MTKNNAATPGKSRRPQKKNQPPESVSIQVQHDAKDSTFIVGDHNQVSTTKHIHKERNITNIVKGARPRDFILYTSLFLFVLAGVYYSFWYTNLRYDRAIASGQLNVLILPFVEQKPWGYRQSDLGWNIAQVLSDGVNASFEESGVETDVNILGPSDKVPTIHGFRESQLERSAETISEKINGQILIYGVITKDEYGDSIVRLKLYISPTNFAEAQELISDFMMGELPIGSFRLTGDTVSGADLLSQNKELRDRLTIFSSIINFLGAYLGEDFDLARQYIEKAGDQTLWGNANGLEVVYLIHGNMEVRQARAWMVKKDLQGTMQAIEAAKGYFHQAMITSVKNGNGSYARAYLGLAGAESLSAIAEANIAGDASLIHTEALDRSLEQLALAEEAEYRPETADVTVKANYARAQASLAYYAKSVDPEYRDSARNYYQLVIDEYARTGNQRIAEFASLSYSGLAHIAVQDEKPQTAIEYFLSAQEVSHNPVFKVQCLVNLGDVYFSRQEYESALKYYQDALARKVDLEKAISTERILEIEKRVNFIQKSGGSA